MSKVTLISLGTINPIGQDDFKIYAEKAPNLLLQAGGTPVRKMKVHELIKGENGPQTVFMMDFPSAEALKGVFDTEEYKALIPHRDKAFSQLTLLIAEEF
ncbi:MAG: DUF1330 domain-containing protein [Pseudomonadota bacterium]